MFTDVDIFADLLDAAARHVPVYILLDEQQAHYFVSMVINCKVNLDLIPVSLPYISAKDINSVSIVLCAHNIVEILILQMMRVRTVTGITYYSRTGKSFKGQLKDRFLLVDCRAVLSGSYR